MAYTFELYFTGICCFQLVPEENPKRARVLLVNTGVGGSHRHGDHGDHGQDEGHEHKPYLSVAVRNLITMGSGPPAPVQIVPAPDAMDCALFDLTGEEVALESKEAETKVPLRLKQGTGAPVKPPKPVATTSQWWDWVTQLKRLDPRVKGLKQGTPDPLAPNTAGPVAARVEIPFGELGTFELGRRGHQLFLFEFRRYDGKPAASTSAAAAGDPRCIADRLVLRAGGLEEPVGVRMSGQTFGIGPDLLPGTGTVKASVTNFPTEFRAMRPPAVRHFRHYYDLVEWKGGQTPPRDEMIIPWVTQAVNGGHTPSTGSCPPSNG